MKRSIETQFLIFLLLISVVGSGCTSVAKAPSFGAKCEWASFDSANLENVEDACFLISNIVDAITECDPRCVDSSQLISENRLPCLEDTSIGTVEVIRVTPTFFVAHLTFEDNRELLIPTYLGTEGWRAGTPETPSPGVWD